MSTLNKIFARLMVLFGFILAIPIFAAAQTSIKIEAPNVVAVGEVFNFDYVVNEEGCRLTRTPNIPEEFDNLAYTTFSSYSIVNSQRSVEIRFKYTLRANKEGKYTFGEVQMTDGAGKTYECKPVTIEVVKGQAPQQQTGTSGGGSQNNTATPSRSNGSTDDVFIRLSPSRTTLYRGDNLTLSLKIYRNPRVGIGGVSSSKSPAFDGFWTKEIDLGNSQQWKRESVNGVIYETLLWRQWTLSPQKSGSLRIEPAEARFIIQKQSGRPNMWIPDYDEFEKLAKTPAITITVKDMPSGAPQSYSGAVGKYTMTAKLSKDKIIANDAVSVNLKISGNGNFSLISAPKATFPSDFDTYDAKKTESGGSLNFEYVLIPRSAGTFTIEPIQFSYFDPSEGKYFTLSSNPMILEVEKDPNGTNQTIFTNQTTQRDVKILGKDIRFIKMQPESWRVKGSKFFGFKRVYPLYIIALILFAGIYYYLRKRNKNSQNTILMRNRKAKGVARKRLKVANKLMKLNSASGFYEELLKAVYGYVGDKYSLPVSELSRDNVSELLSDKNVDKDDINKLISIVDECEFARYAPGASSTQMHTLYDNTIDIISKLEQKTK